MLDKIKALFAKLREIWSTYPLLQKTVTVPVKLVLIGAAIGVVLIVALSVRRTAEPAVYSLLGMKQPAVVTPAHVQAVRDDLASMRETMVSYGGQIIEACKPPQKRRSRKSAAKAKPETPPLLSLRR